MIQLVIEANIVNEPLNEDNTFILEFNKGELLDYIDFYDLVSFVYTKRRGLRPLKHFLVKFKIYGNNLTYEKSLFNRTYPHGKEFQLFTDILKYKGFYTI